jgi:hypothetical protein
MSVEVNGKRVCLPSLVGTGNVTASIRWLREDDAEGLLLSVIGTDGVWETLLLIQLNDEIRVRIVEEGKAERPLNTSSMVTPPPKS